MAANEISGKEKLDSDYKSFKQNIEDLAQKARTKIQSQAEEIKEEAKKIGENLNAT